MYQGIGRSYVKVPPFVFSVGRPGTLLCHGTSLPRAWHPAALLPVLAGACVANVLGPCAALRQRTVGFYPSHRRNQGGKVFCPFPLTQIFHSILQKNVWQQHLFCHLCALCPFGISRGRGHPVSCFRCAGTSSRLFAVFPMPFLPLGRRTASPARAVVLRDGCGPPSLSSAGNPCRAACRTRGMRQWQ